MTYEELFPPDRYELVPKVCVFKTHQRVKNDRLVKVTRADLERIATTHNDRVKHSHRASPFSKGHTEDPDPEAGVPFIREEDQPDVCGYGVRFFVEDSPSEPEESYLYCDLYLKKKDREILEDWPAISPEYLPRHSLLYPIAFLKTSPPELAMPPPLHRYQQEASNERPYRVTLTNPLSYSLPPEKVMNDAEKNPTDAKKEPPKDKSEDKAVKDATKVESKGSKSDASDMSDLKQLISQLTPLLEVMPQLLQLAQMMQEEGPEGDDGLMQPADKKPPTDTADKSAPDAPKPPEKEPTVADRNEPPVKFDSSCGSATNGFIPSDTKKKDAYKMSDDDKLKYKKEVESELAVKYKTELDAQKKVTDQLLKENRQAKAKEMVKDLEEVYMIQYASDEIRQQDIKMLAALEPVSAKQYCEMAKVRYAKKLPDSKSVAEVAKYAIESEPDLTPKTAEEAQARAMKIIQSGLSPAEFYKKMAEGKGK